MKHAKQVLFLFVAFLAFAGPAEAADIQVEGYALTNGKYVLKKENVVRGSFVDKRDGKSYRTVRIGPQTWMAENLDYDYKVNGASYGSMCYNDSAEYCARYGRLYTWAATMDSATTGCGMGRTCAPVGETRGVCPEGWHVPRFWEWRIIGTITGEFPGTALKSAAGWSEGEEGSDDYGFSVLPGGGRNDDGRFADVGALGYYFSASEKGAEGAEGIRFHGQTTDVYFVIGEKRLALSVRCVKNAEKTETGSFTDSRDGKSYKWTKIGSQTWMAENLNYDYKVNGSTYGNWCYNALPANCGRYGRLYTWAAAMDSATTGCGSGGTCAVGGRVRGVCPAGWHLPDSAEWGALGAAVGNRLVGGAMLKSMVGWTGVRQLKPGTRDEYVVADGNGLDNYGFSALPAGMFNAGIGQFSGVRMVCGWISTDQTQEGFVRAWWMSNENLSLLEDNAFHKESAASVRCVKD